MENKNGRNFYKNIGRAWCPELNDYVAFTNAGIQHLMRKNGKSRLRNEQVRRFRLLPYAKEIIEGRDIKISHGKGETVRFSKQHDMAVIKKLPADFWKLTKTYGDVAITVVVRQIEGKEKHFFSIYNAKTKKSKNRHMTVI
jgi:hypothetical protein